MPEKSSSEHRIFERFPTDLEVDVEGVAEHGLPFSDLAPLRNISGGGFCLLTGHADNYHLSQLLNVKIRLPSTDMIDAFMSCDAAVVWIHSLDSADAAQGVALIGVELNHPMAFESHRHLPTISDPRSNS